MDSLSVGIQSVEQTVATVVKLNEYSNLNSDFILNSTNLNKLNDKNLNYTSKSNTTTNTSSSSNSLTFTEEEDNESFAASNSSKSALNTIDTATEATSDSNNASSSLNSIRGVSQIASACTSSSSTSSASSTTSSASENADLGLVKLVKQQSQQLKLDEQNTKYIFILNAFVNGFAQLKLCADKIDYEYIIEIYWSNEAKSFVKRTYDDFVAFHLKLIQAFSQFFNPTTNNNQSNAKAFGKKIANKDSINTNNLNNSTKINSKMLGNSFDANSLPILPSSKKPFWVSHLKLAESREIELNSYVQRLLKLPTKIAHSQLVLKFFETQTSDPKPAKYSLRVLNNKKEDMEVFDRDFNNVAKQKSLSNTSIRKNNQNEDEHGIYNQNIIDSNSTFEDDEHVYDENEYDIDDDDDDEDDDEDDEIDDDDYYNNHDSNNNVNLNNNLDMNNSTSKRNSCRLNQSVGLNGSILNVKYKKKLSREAGLWWDEDEALNELTSSMSFDFGNHNFNVNNNANFNSFNEEANEDVDEELETLKTLEKILKHSELFRNDTKENSISSSSTTMLSSNSPESQLYKRLSLS